MTVSGSFLGTPAYMSPQGVRGRGRAAACVHPPPGRVRRRRVGPAPRVPEAYEESELKEIRRVAREKRMTVAEWVRQALRDARKQAPASDAGRKLGAVRAAARHAFPSADIETMLAEISRGYDPSAER